MSRHHERATPVGPTRVGPAGRTAPPPVHGPSPAATRLHQLHGAAGNARVTRLLERSGHAPVVQRVIDPPGPDDRARLVGLAQRLSTLCDSTDAVAWELYRAVLQLAVDRVDAAQGRTSAFGAGADAGAHRDAVAALRTVEQATAADRAQIAQAQADVDAVEAADFRLTLGRLQEREAAARQALRAIGDRAFQLGVQAEGDGHLRAARHAFGAADRAELVTDPRVPIDIATGRAVGVDVAELYAIGDTTANTIGGGIAGNVMSGIGVVAAEGTTAFNVGFAAGAVFGPLSILCSLVNTGVAVRGALSSGERKRELAGLAQQLSDPRARQFASYAAEQKGRKEARRWMSTGAAVVGLAAGIGACVALGVASFGVGALAMGVIAGSIGLGFLIYRMVRRSQWGTSRKMDGLARELLAAAADPSDPAVQAHAVAAIANLSLDTAAGLPTQAQVRSALVDAGIQRRRATAVGVVDALVNGSRSERHDVEQVVAGLRLAPEELVELVTQGRGTEAVDKVLAKLASW